MGENLDDDGVISNCTNDLDSKENNIRLTTNALSEDFPNTNFIVKPKEEVINGKSTINTNQPPIIVSSVSTYIFWINTNEQIHIFII
jgi:hypothetical protein